MFADLKPYICTFSDCEDHLLIFPSRKLWELHEFGQHRVTRHWSCHKCSQMDNSEAEWKLHLEESHQIIFAAQELEVARQIADKTELQAIESQKCPFCLQAPSITQREFVKHITKHMEGIALVALPLEAESDSEEASVASEVSLLSPISKSPLSPDVISKDEVKDTAEEWDLMKPLIKSLYVDNSLNFSKVSKILAEKHNFLFTLVLQHSTYS